MNLFYHSVYVLFAIHLIFIGVHRVVNSKDVLSQNHFRPKRVYAGSDVKDDQFPYVVFIKSFPSNKNNKSSDPVECKEQLCTGTLVHTRFALTLLSCVVSAEEKIKIFPHNIHVSKHCLQIYKGVINAITSTLLLCNDLIVKKCILFIILKRLSACNIF